MHKTDYSKTRNPRSLAIAEMAIPFPEWIKGRPIPTSEGFEKLASVAFADRENRLLPIFEKEAAFFSAVDYFANAGEYPEEVFDHIKEACAYFGIGADVAPYAEYFAGEFEKQASAETPSTLPGRFGIDTTLNGTHFRLLPLNDPYEIAKSARDLATMVDQNRIHYLMFVDAAREVVKAAADACVIHEIPGLIVQAGTPRFEDLDKAASLIESRRSLVSNYPGAFSEYEEAVKQAAAGEISPEDCMRKIAATDSAIGLRYNFNPRHPVPLPHNIVFGGPTVEEVEKMAASHALIRGVPVPLEALRQIATVDAEFHLEKAAFDSFIALRSQESAAPLSLEVAGWGESDQKALLKMAVEANP